MRGLRRWLLNFSIPAPRVVIVPVARAFSAVRYLWYFLYRILACEPFFKSYCRKHGKNLHTGSHLHWFQGQGDLFVGDNVHVDGKSAFSFAARYVDRPRLEIGNNTAIGHDCQFTVAEKVVIGENCMIGGGTFILDSPGHPTDPYERIAGMPAPREKVRPVTIEDNVWIGRRCIIMPGVIIGRNSVIAAGSVVVKTVPPNTLVGGNPAVAIRPIA